MGIIKEWSENKKLRNEIEQLRQKIEMLSNTIQLIKDKSEKGELIDNLILENKKIEKELFKIRREYDSLKEWSQRILEISKKESSELTYYKFHYFYLQKEHQQILWALNATKIENDFALTRFESVRDENAVLKEKLRKYEQSKK